MTTQETNDIIIQQLNGRTREPGMKGKNKTEICLQELQSVSPVSFKRAKEWGVCVGGAVLGLHATEIIQNSLNCFYTD